MFYKVTLRKMITVEPKDLGNTLNRALEKLLRQAVEGGKLPAAETVSAITADIKSMSKSSAVIIAVLDILHAETLQGKVLDNGCVSFLLTYEALVFKLHRGEVVDVKVVSVGPEGWYGTVFGINRIFVSRAQMSLSIQNPTWEYDNDGRWFNKSENISLLPDSIVRVRIVAETPQTEDTMAVASMTDKYLGPVVY